MNEAVTKRFLLYFRLMLLVWILIANAIIHVTGMEYSWLIFLSNIMMFTLEGDVKDRFVTVELGGLVGLILTVIALLSITALTPILGGFFGFLIPLAGLTGQEVTFTGRGRLMERPQSVYKTLYQQQGLRFEQGADRLTVEGALTPGEYELAGNVSSQFISGLLFALPLLAGDSTLHLIPPVESRSYIEMTRAAQAAFGVTSHWLDDTTLCIPGGQQYHPRDYIVEGDYSQAAFLAVLGAVKGGITLTGLAAETLQGDAAILDILRRCGAQFTREGDTVTFAKAPLHGVDIDLADCPDLGPVLMVLGLLCEGTTVIRNAERLRLKESDRIAAMEAELRACGGVLESEGGTITVHGCAGLLHAPAAPLHGHNDHRVVMSLAVLSAAAGLPLTVDDAEAIQKSWPGFFADAAPLGVEVEDA